MKKENAYKIKLVKLLEILRQDSDEDHYLTTGYLLSKLGEEGIECDRRTLYADVDLLNAYGYEVLCEKSPGTPNKYCIADRSFDVSELRILMDAVQASKFITQKKTDKLLVKIADLAGSHKAELLQSNVVDYSTAKSDNENIFYSISEINGAIEKGKKVSFEYFDYDYKHSRVLRREGKRYYVNPLATVFDDDNYYLIAYYAKHEGVVHYRIDRMDHVEIVDNQPIDAYKGKKVDLKAHKKTVFAMYQGEKETVEFIVDKSILDPVFDTFSSDVKLYKVAEDKYRFKASVQLSPVFYGWCLSFGNKLKITAPKSVREKFVEFIKTTIDGYTL